MNDREYDQIMKRRFPTTWVSSVLPFWSKDGKSMRNEYCAECGVKTVAGGIPTGHKGTHTQVKCLRDVKLYRETTPSFRMDDDGSWAI